MKKTLDEMLSELQPIFRSVLEVDDLTVTPEMTMDDVPEWDSVAQIELVSEIGRTYGISLTTQEQSLWENAGDLAASVLRKIENQ